MAELIATDAERVRHVLLNKTNASLYKEPITNNQNIEFYTKLENGTLENLEQDPNKAFYLLSKGNLKEAYTFISNFEDYKPFLYRFIAGSKGASKEMINTAMELPNEVGINYDTVWLALGLAIREKADITNYIKVMNGMGIKTNTLNTFIKHIKRSDFKKAHKEIEQQNFELKAHFYILANVALDNNIPENWKNYIKSVLFVNQRPYL